MTEALDTSQEREPDRDAQATGTHVLGRVGGREREVLEILWANGSATVQQVSSSLPVRLAYTTVMTTLDRLFKKGLLRRVKQDRAFLYIPTLSPSDVESGRAQAMVHRFFSGAPSSKDMLLSCLVDAIGDYDDEMLRQLEEKVRTARQRLESEQGTSSEAPEHRS